jgi:hypothetical protein
LVNQTDVASSVDYDQSWKSGIPERILRCSALIERERQVEMPLFSKGPEFLRRISARVATNDHKPNIRPVPQFGPRRRKFRQLRNARSTPGGEKIDDQNFSADW